MGLNTNGIWAIASGLLVLVLFCFLPTVQSPSPPLLGMCIEHARIELALSQLAPT